MTDEPVNEGKSGTPIAALIAAGAALMRVLGHEMTLARYDAARAARDAQIALVCIVLGLLFGIMTLNLLTGAAVAGLVAADIHPAWAMVIVAVVCLAITAVALMIGIKRLKVAKEMPERRWLSLRRSLLSGRK